MVLFPLSSALQFAPLASHCRSPLLLPCLCSISGARAPKSFGNCAYEKYSFCRILVQCNAFRINTCKSVTKQTTLTFFRINTYEKHRGRGVLLLTRHPTKDDCPERPSGARDLSSFPTKVRFVHPCGTHEGPGARHFSPECVSCILNDSAGRPPGAEGLASASLSTVNSLRAQADSPEIRATRCCRCIAGPRSQSC